MIKRIFFLSLLCFAGLAHAQTNAKVVAVCGAGVDYSGIVGLNGAQTVNTAGQLCGAASSSGGGTVAQGTAAADSGSWPVHLVFGTTALALGQALSAASMPVVLPAAQITSLTPPTSMLPLSVTTTDKSGTITTGGTPQSPIASNASRKGFCVQNSPTATEVLNVRLNGTASATTGTSLQPGAQACNQPGLVDTSAVSVFAATTGHVFTAWEVQ